MDLAVPSHFEVAGKRSVQNSYDQFGTIEEESAFLASLSYF
jgi:hypothetical protein